VSGVLDFYSLMCVAQPQLDYVYPGVEAGLPFDIVGRLRKAEIEPSRPNGYQRQKRRS
jgi:hypothetical protein